MNNRIRLLATTDVHGYVYPYSYADHSPVKQGFAQLRTMIDQLRDENTLVLDNGDVLEGATLSFFHYRRYPDELSPVTIAMREIGYDYVNIGNHDFNYGQEALMMHLQNVGAPCITNNFLYHNKPFGPNYVIREIAGKKVALLGVVTQYIVNWETKAHLKHIRFTDAFETLKKNVELVKSLEKPDYIIAMYHGGMERDLVSNRLTEDDTGENEGSRMLAEIPDLDILISGHQHRTLCGTKNNIVYTQTTCNGSELACIDIYTDTDTIEPRIIKCEGEADEEIQKRCQKEEDECQKWLDQTLGTTNVDLKVTNEFDARLHKTQMITFLNQVQMETTGAEISSSALFMGATGFNHEITMRNLVSTYVYPNSMVVKKMSGKALRAYLEKDAEYWSMKADGTVGVNPEYDEPKPQHYNYDMLDGIEYTIKVSNPAGQRIISLTRNGQEIKDDDEFTVCMNNYRAAGGGNFNMIPPCETVHTDLTSMVELLADYIMKHKVIDFEPVNNIKVVA